MAAAAPVAGGGGAGVEVLVDFGVVVVEVGVVEVLVGRVVVDVLVGRVVVLVDVGLVEVEVDVGRVVVLDDVGWVVEVPVGVCVVVELEVCVVGAGSVSAGAFWSACASAALAIAFRRCFSNRALVSRKVARRCARLVRCEERREACAPAMASSSRATRSARTAFSEAAARAASADAAARSRLSAVPLICKASVRRSS